MKTNPKDIFLTAKDYLVSGETFDLLYDAERKMLITSPQPSLENVSKYYESKEYISHTDNKKGLINSLYQQVKKRALQSKSDLIFNLNNGTGSLLDIGAGTGDFLNIAEQKGWKINGVEPNKNARDLAASKNVILKETLKEFTGNKFDVITLWHVLEHLPNLEDTIHKIENLLAPGGTLIIAVPNYNSFDSNYYKSHWAAFDVPRHLWHFSQSAMKVIFSKELSLHKIKPLVFDSFYVSLLSEKNKNGNTNFAKAFFIGLWSNISAWSSKEYSSLIYCYKNTK
ncbi:class I SAM-dependent methyltransferase [Candidatus Marifrigoribacter sp. Uisw_064]|uniref:class I SAM-dependent methyltransferase n=1 Tax=Candidatus Marifrigoribacter sp. Uisw_064 TaxID=3230970 RepID=UPI003D5AF013